MKSPWRERLQPSITNPPRSKLVKKRRPTDHPSSQYPINLVQVSSKREAVYLDSKADVKKHDQPDFFHLEDVRTSRSYVNKSTLPPMNHSIIPGPVPAAAGQHWVERPLYRAHRLRPEAHPRPQAGFNRQNQAEYPSDFRPPNAHRDGRVTNEFSQFSGRPRQTASRGASHYAAERRDVRQTERHGKFTKAVSSEGSQPTDVQEKRTAHEDSDIKQARPVQTTERPLQGFGLEYAGRDDFDGNQIKGPELGCLEQKKDSDDRVANLSVNEETADALWIEIEDLLHEMSPESSNHLPREHGPEIEEVNVHTVLQGPFMTKEDMPPRIRDILAKASKLSQQPRHLAGPSISAHSLELLHPDIICAIRALRDEEP